MKKTILLLLSFTTLLVEAQTTTPRLEITPFIVNSIIVKDTTKLSTMMAETGQNTTLHDYNNEYGHSEHYLNSIQFSTLKNSVFKMMKSPGQNLYAFIGGAKLDQKAIKDRLISCDSVTESFYDEKGKEVTEKRLLCDSNSVVRQIQRIDFYETWFYNAATHMIEREDLGYSVYAFNEAKGFYREVYCVFKSRQAYEKTLKYMIK